MAIPVGIVAARNIAGKQVALPAVTTANQNSGYVFTTASTAQIGQVTVTKSNLGSYSSATNPTYDAPSATMSFNGTNQAIGYLPSSQIQVAPVPFSCQFEFKTFKETGFQYLVNLGQGNNVGWPCWQMSISGTNLVMASATADGNVGRRDWTIQPVQMNTWYRVGCMYYRIGNDNYVRVYVNGAVKLNEKVGTSTQNVGGQGGLPRNIPDSTSQAGLSLGNDGANATGYNLYGRMRNFFLGKTLFWPI